MTNPISSDIPKYRKKKTGNKPYIIYWKRKERPTKDHGFISRWVPKHWKVYKRYRTEKAMMDAWRCIQNTEGYNGLWKNIADFRTSKDLTDVEMDKG